MNQIVPWESPITDIAAIDKDLLKFYFDQAEKCLKASVDLSDRITTRCYALLAVVIPVLTITIGTLAKSEILGDKLSQNAHYIIFVAIIPLLICFAALVWTAFPKNYTYLGSSPKNKIFSTIFDNPDFLGIDSYKLALTFEIEEYQGRIDYADYQNNIRVRNVKWSFIIILGTLGAYAVGLITYYFVFGT